MTTAVNVFLRPRQVLREATHDTIKIVKKLLKKGNKHCLSSASTQLKEIYTTLDYLEPKPVGQLNQRNESHGRIYVSKSNYKTPIKKVWDMVRKISGKSKSASYKHLNTNLNNTEAKATSKKDIADTLGSTFMKNSSNRN